MRAAIALVLERANEPLSVPEVWRRIVRQRLYRRRDGGLPTEQHVYAFILQNPKLYELDRSQRPMRVRLRKGPRPKNREKGMPARKDSKNLSWATERAVQERLVRWLEGQGWEIIEAAEGSTHGPDLVARRGDETLVVEVKGFPGKRYARGPKKDDLKRTQPYTQMRHYFAGALTDLLRRRNRYPGAGLALALPPATTYRNLARDLSWALERLGVLVLFVSQDGETEAYVPDS